MANKRDAAAAFGEPDGVLAQKHDRKRRRRAKRKERPTDENGASNHKEEDAVLPVRGEVSPSKANTSASNEIVSKKRKRSKSSKEISRPPTQDEEKPRKHKKRRKRERRSEHQTKVKALSHQKSKDKGFIRTTEGWTFFPTAGGRSLDQDPILTNDEKYLIFPTRLSIEVYSATTSLPVRQLRVRAPNHITSCAISSIDEHHLYVSTSQKGTIIKWNWSDGQRLARWDLGRSLSRILGVMPADTAKEERVLLLRENQFGKHDVELCQLPSEAESTCEITTLVSRDVFLSSVGIGPKGDVIVLCSNHRLLLGRRDSSSKSQDRLVYTWRDFTVPGNIVSLDTKFRRADLPGKGRLVVDVVLGFANGVIHIYEDILHRIVQHERRNEKDEITSRRLHWHRGPVNALKWSRDGNYLISGGNETVLTIWQLDTNQKQFLPHLSTSIMNLSISRPGSAYVLRLADNSVMILNTKDLLPSANVNGLAIDGRRSFPAVMHPKNPNQLIIAGTTMASSHFRRRPRLNATILQTYDIVSNVQIGRQALTRNVFTNVNVNPAGQLIVEPDVVFLSISHDGQWLTTVDRWSPPASDLDPLYPGSEEDHSAERKNEICLRFWLWNAETQTWELVTRIDHPHDTGDVLGLIVNPKRLEVATAGVDGSLRFWSPKSRVRNGIAVKDQAGSQLYTWTGSGKIEVEADLSRDYRRPMSIALAYSEDGSVIAASWSAETEIARIIHLIDTKTKTTNFSQPNLLTSGAAQLAFSGRHLLCLSRQRFCAWDTVSLKIVFGISLKPDFTSETNTGIIVANRHDGTFALGLNSQQEERESSQLAIFNITAFNESPKPLYQNHLHCRISNILTRSQGPGYVIIDNETRISTLIPASENSSPPSAPAVIAESEEVRKGLDSILGPVELAAGPSLHEDESLKLQALPAPDEGQSERKSLETVLQVSTPTSLSVRGLFERVAALFARNHGPGR